MTPEKEIELCETVATIAADLKHAMAAQTAMAVQLAEHTQADHDNFEKLSNKMDGLITKSSIEEAVKADNIEDAKKVATRKAAIVSVIVSVVSVAAGAWLQKLFGL